VDLVILGSNTAENLLAQALPRRWVHVQAVAAKALRVSNLFLDDERHVLVAAAWLHDVGYASEVAASGLHALDGARWLREQGFNDRLSALVAHHSCALFEAEERGLAKELQAEFNDEKSAVRDALWYCDMTTGPDGQDLDIHERLAEVRSRYGPDHLVTRFWTRAEPDIVAVVRRTEERLAAAGSQPM
jgi:hypothetical protein